MPRAFRPDRLTETLANAGELALFAALAPVALVASLFSRESGEPRHPRAIPKPATPPDGRT